MQSEDDMALGLKPDAESRETRMAGSCWWVRLMVISNSSLYRKVQMFASPQACRATERSYLTPSSLSSHLALFYWWTNLQWGDKGRQAFSINALIRAQQALQHLSDWQPSSSGFCRHPILLLYVDAHAQHTHVQTHACLLLLPLMCMDIDEN